MRNIFEIEGALGHLPLSFRRWEMEDGILYFCEAADQTTFNLHIGEGGDLRIWQFLPAEPSGGEAGLRIEWVFGSCRFGLEVTQDRILNLYLDRDLSSVPEERLESVLQQTISGFLAVSSRFPAVEFAP